MKQRTVGRGIVVAAMMVCLCRTGWAEVTDLTKPYGVDKDTIALYHMDDVATGKIQDAVPGGKPGIVIKGAMSTLGRFGDAMTCNGIKGWIDVDNLPSGAGLKAETVELWVKFYGAPGGDIIVRNSQYMMRVGGTLTAYFGIDGSWKTLSGTKPLPTNKWTHLAMTYEEATKKISIYVDGELDISAVPQGITAGKLNAGDNKLRIGTRTWWENSGIINGAMDEIRISSVARQYAPLHPSEVKPIPANTNLVTNGGFESGMHGWLMSGEVNANLLWHIEKGNAPQGKSYLAANDKRANMVMSYPFRVVRGKAVTMSATMKADKACMASLGVRSTGGPKDSKTVQVGTEWGRVSSRLTIGADWPTDVIYVEFGANEGALLDIDAVTVVIGDKTDFTETEAESIGIDATLPKQSTYMLKDGGKMPLELINTGDKEQRFTMSCTVTNWEGKTVKEIAVPVKKLAPGEAVSATINVPDGRVGWFEARFVAKRGDQIIKATSRIYNVIEPMKGVGDVFSSPLGMNTHMEREPDEFLDCNLGMLSLCGVKWIRGWWGWGMAEKQPGQFDWKEYDRQLAAVNRAGMEIMPILLRYYKAYEQAWAGPLEKKIEEFPYSVDQWGSFTKATAARYKGKVKAWEVWNEPNNTYPAEKYAPLLKKTYESVKEADPKAWVVGGGGVPPALIMKLCELGCAKSLDIMSNHSYSELGRPFEQMEVLWEADKAIWEKMGCTKRVWHTEQGSQADGMGFMATGQTEEDCAVNLSQSYLSALGTGVEKFFWFSSQTSVRYGWAVYYENYIPRPRLIAVNGLARMLNRRQVKGRMMLANGNVACVTMDGKAGPAVALWNIKEITSLQLPKGPEVTLLDMLANPIEDAKAGGIELKYGHPIFVVAKSGTLKDLTATLAKAKVDEGIPIEVRRSEMRATGHVGLAFLNHGDRNIDLRVTVEGPGMTKETALMNDIGPENAHVYYPKFEKSPAAGTEVTVKVKIEAGGLVKREEVREIKVKF